MKEQAASLRGLETKLTTLKESHKTSLQKNKQLQEEIDEVTAKAASASASVTELQNTEVEISQRLGALQDVEQALRSQHEKSLAKLQASARTALENKEQRAVLEKELGSAKENVKRLMAEIDASETEHSAAAQSAKVCVSPCVCDCWVLRVCFASDM